MKKKFIAIEDAKVSCAVPGECPARTPQDIENLPF